MKQTKVEKETTVDKTLTTQSSISNIVTTEKADTTIQLIADTSYLSYLLPWLEYDTSTSYQEVETPTGKISISVKPILSAGKRTSSLVTATAIRKQDSITVKIDKTTITNTQAKTQIKNDITTRKEVKEKNNQVTKQRFSFTGVLLILSLVLIIIFIWYDRKKRKQT